MMRLNYLQSIRAFLSSTAPRKGQPLRTTPLRAPFLAFVVSALAACGVADRVENDEHSELAASATEESLEPVAATGYVVQFTDQGHPRMMVAGSVRTPDGKSVPIANGVALAEPGKPLTVIVDPKRFGDRAVKEIVVGLQTRHEWPRIGLPPDPENRNIYQYATISDGSRDSATGELLLKPAVFQVPDDQREEMHISFLPKYVDSSPTFTGCQVDIASEKGARLTFADHLSLDGELQAGARLELTYDKNRLGRQLLLDGDHKVTAYISFDGSQATELTMEPRDGAASPYLVLPAIVAIPTNAKRMSIWFRGEHNGQVTWDSRGGANINFMIAPPRHDPFWDRVVIGATDMGTLEADDFEAIGPPDDTYNAISWTIGVRDRWIRLSSSVEDFDRFYGDRGFKPSSGSDLTPEPGIEKVALYGKKSDSGVEITHAALMDEGGFWTSKLGPSSLIRHHDPKVIFGPAFGHSIVKVYRRARPSVELGKAW